MKLYVTYCSAKKIRGTHPPDILYVSDRIARFVERCKNAEVKWAIFSALYAFFFPEEKKKDYNITFKTHVNYWLGISVVEEQGKLSYEKSRKHIEQLISILRQQVMEHNVDQIVFYGPSPKMMKCYLGILHYAFDGCSELHDWNELIDHVRSQSETIKVIHRLDSIHQV